MKKLKSLDRYQKGVFLFMIVMVLAFTAAYFVTTSRKGFAYGDAILIPRQENGSTVYSGKIQGSQASFTVSEGQTVEFQYGDKIYGPYIYQEDPAAVPEDSELKDSLIGVEIRRGNRILFRGGMLEGDSRWLYNEDGSPEGSGFLIVTNTGIMTDENGNIIDPMEPPVSVLLDLLVSRSNCLRIYRIYHFVCGRAVPVEIVLPDSKCRQCPAFGLGNNGTLYRLDGAADSEHAAVYFRASVT